MIVLAVTWILTIALSTLLPHGLSERRRHRQERTCGCRCGYVWDRATPRTVTLICLAPDDPDPTAHFQRLQDGTEKVNK